MQDFLLVLSAVAAVMYGFVAWLQARRPVPRDARGARRGFVLWWAGLAFVTALGLVFTVGPGLGSLSLAAYRLVVYPLLAFLVIMLAGLCHYLLFLYTGRPRAWLVPAVFYLVVLLGFVWLIEAHGPYMGIETDPDSSNFGERTLLLEDEPAPWIGAVLGLALVGPAFAAAVAYALLAFRTDDRTARYRIIMVSSGFVLWFGFSVLGTIGRAVQGVEEAGLASRVTSQLLGLTAAALCVLAYWPPRAWQERWGVRAVLHVPEERDPFQPPSRLAVATA